MSETSSNTRVEAAENIDNIEPRGNNQNAARDSDTKDGNHPRARFQDPFSNQQVENVEAEAEAKSDRRILAEWDCTEELGFGFSESKKWTVLSIIFLVQVSMNFNTSLYSNALEGISSTYGVSEQGARCK